MAKYRQLNIHLRGAASPIEVIGPEQPLADFVRQVWGTMHSRARVEGFKQLEPHVLVPITVELNASEVIATTICGTSEHERQA